MSTAATDYLGIPLLTTPGIPLRVAVYTRLSQGIRTGVFGLGESLPRETELAAALGVSRTVVREALMLLEEDGLIRTRRGVGRFVAKDSSFPGLEQLRPLDLALSTPEATVVLRELDLSRQEPTDFVRDHVELGEGQDIWFREAVIEMEGRPIALIQEYLPVDDRSTLGKTTTRAVEQSRGRGVSALRNLLDEGLTPTEGSCQIGASIAGTTRARHLGITPTSPVLLLTQKAQLDGRTIYLAKCAVVPSVGHLVIRQFVTT